MGYIFHVDTIYCFDVRDLFSDQNLWWREKIKSKECRRSRFFSTHNIIFYSMVVVSKIMLVPKRANYQYRYGAAQYRYWYQFWYRQPHTR